MERSRWMRWVLVGIRIAEVDEKSMEDGEFWRKIDRQRYVMKGSEHVEMWLHKRMI